MKNINFFVIESTYESQHIELAGYPEEDHRLPRLHRVVGYVQALQDLKRHKVLNMVGKLIDHKGILRVYWAEIPHETDKKVFEDAWESGIAGEAVVEHLVHNEKYMV